MPIRPNYLKWLTGIGVILGIGALYVSRVDQTAGEFRDDGWYLLLGQSLAEGKGYQMVNFPFDLGAPIYPPLFPVLLSIVFRISPNFPANLFLLKSISILAMLAFGLAVYFFFLQRGRTTFQAFGIALLTVTAPAFVFLATSTVMSECVFSLLQFLTILLIEQLDRITLNHRKLWLVGLAALLAAAAWLTRSIAITLFAAVLLHFLLQRRFREITVFTGIILLVFVPWTLYSKKQINPTSTIPDVRYLRTSYSEHILFQNSGSLRKIQPSQLPARFLQNELAVFQYATGNLLLPVLYRPTLESGTEAIGTPLWIGYGPNVITNSFTNNSRLPVVPIVVATIVSIIGAIGFCLRWRRQRGPVEYLTLATILIVAIFPWPQFRYLLPLFPFFIDYFLTGLEQLATWTVSIRKTSTASNSDVVQPIVRITLSCIIGLNLYEHAECVRYGRFESPPQTSTWAQNFRSSKNVLQWVHDHLPPDEVVATDNPSLTYMYSRLKTRDLSIDQARKLNIRFYVWTDPAGSPPGFLPGEQILFRSPENPNAFVVRLTP